jgi:hypothetical protein
MLLIDGVRGILTGAGVEDDTVQQILDMLNEAKGAVRKGGDIEMAPAASYGGASTAAELGTHAGKAHHHVVAAMTQMVEGLGMYHQSVEHFRQDVHETDATEATEYTRRAQRSGDVNVDQLIDMGNACNTPTDFSTNTTCEVPAEGSDQ